MTSKNPKGYERAKSRKNTKQLKRAKIIKNTNERKRTPMHEAEVRRRTCGVKKYVPWEFRHAGKDKIASGHSQVRCISCPTGREFTDYTGRMRGEVPVGQKPIGYGFI